MRFAIAYKRFKIEGRSLPYEASPLDFSFSKTVLLFLTDWKETHEFLSHLLFQPPLPE